MMMRAASTMGGAGMQIEARVRDDYSEARAAFRAAATAAGAELESVLNPGVPAPDGGALTAEIAWVGPKDARKVLLCTSGMHGFEGPAGSAAQTAWLVSGAPVRLPQGVAVCLVHALNPWGFAHISRLTENNVDLNRNFIDWRAPPPPNPYYHRVKDVIRVADMSGETLMKLIGAQEALVKELGPAAAQVAVDFGQYDDPQGITFGGAGREFGHRLMEERVAPRLAAATELGLIDWHTGVGAYGEIAILPVDGAGSANAGRITAWWGAELVEGWKRSALEAEIEADPNQKNMPNLKTGQMKQALKRWLPQARISGAVIEFGTAKDGEFANLVYITIYERYLRFVLSQDGRGGNRLAPEHTAFRKLARAAFVPEDEAWRALVLSSGPRLMDQAVEGLAAL